MATVHRKNQDKPRNLAFAAPAACRLSVITYYETAILQYPFTATGIEAMTAIATATSIEVLQQLQGTNELLLKRIEELEEDKMMLLAERDVHEAEMKEIRRQLGSMRGA
jgi:hypothetical protein